MDENQKTHITSHTKITQHRFADLIPSEWESTDGTLRVTYHPYQFLGGGISLYTTKLIHNGKVIAEEQETLKIIELYSQKLLELFPMNELQN